MASLRLLSLALCFGACAAPQVKSERPSWSSQASNDVACSKWLARSEQTQNQNSWRLRAARRAFLCLETESKDPGPALRMALKLSLEEPHSLELAERYFSGSSDAGRLKIFEPFEGQSVLLDAAVLIGRASSAELADRPSLWRATVERDPDGVRGRRAMLALAQAAPDSSQKIVWLKRALAPHRGVLSSFGHAEFAGLSQAALELIKLCRESGDQACERFATKRRKELER